MDACLPPLFDRIDTFILRVGDYEAAASWYAAILGLRASFTDPAERLAVIPMTQGTSLTLWERASGDLPPDPRRTAFPIFATADANATWQALQSRGVEVSDLVEGPGVRFFSFCDSDGNRLEACETLADELASTSL